MRSQTGAMKLRAILISAALVAYARGENTCRAVAGDRIYASDLAAVAPVFSALNPELEVGLSPLTGIQRVFHPADLLRLARANGIAISGTPAEVCFERRGGSARVASASSAPAPLAVKRGDKVSVMVVAGGVVLKFDSEAESAGHVGDSVIVRNPENGNRFSARVEDPGKVVVNK